jgi:hypothetical protein
MGRRPLSRGPIDFDYVRVRKDVITHDKLGPNYLR